MCELALHEPACIFLGDRRHSYSNTTCTFSTSAPSFTSLRSFAGFPFQFVGLASSPLSVCIAATTRRFRPLAATCIFGGGCEVPHSPTFVDHTKLLAGQYGRPTPLSDPEGAVPRSSGT